MWLKNFFQSLTASSSHRYPVRRGPQSARLCLEAIEDRCVPSYSVIDLGSLGGGYTHASDINALGQVVGQSQPHAGSVHAFIWQTGIMTDLGSLGGLSGYASASGINDIGQVVGYATAFDGLIHAFLLTPEDTDGNGAPDRWFRDSNIDGKNDLMLDLGANSYAYDVNNAGRVVGLLGTGSYQHAFRWQNGIMTDLGTLGGDSSNATAINDAGQVTGVSGTSTGGSSAFLWQGSVMHDIGGSASDINQSGQVAGASGSYATVWTPTTPNGTTGSFQPLGVLPRDLWDPFYQFDGEASGASAVNDLGTVVGSSVAWYTAYDLEGNTYPFATSRGFVWADGVMEELPTLQNAVAINNAGQIVGNGPYSYIGESPYRAYLLTPDSATTPTMTIGDVTVTEGNTGTRAASFTVTLSTAYSQPVSVAYATANGTAAAGSDYQSASGTLTFAPGEMSKTITILVNGDRLAEPNETFFINLSSPTNATIADGQAVGTIVDDEPRISIGDVSKAEGRKGQTTFFTFTVTLSAAYDQAVTMSFRTANGTATTGNGDYVAKTGTLTFAPGETTKTITVEVKGDSKREANEYFYLDLFGNSGNSLFTKNRGLGTILNDD